MEKWSECCVWIKLIHVENNYVHGVSMLSVIRWECVFDCVVLISACCWVYHWSHPSSNKHINEHINFPQVSIPIEGLVKRQYHTATAIAVSFSQIVVVVFGQFFSDNKLHPGRSDAFLLEFGNYIINVLLFVHWRVWYWCSCMWFRKLLHLL